MAGAAAHAARCQSRRSRRRSRGPGSVQLGGAHPLPDAPIRLRSPAGHPLARLLHRDQRTALFGRWRRTGGVVFRYLDADRALPVVAARTVAALPYNWAPSGVRIDAVAAEY